MVPMNNLISSRYVPFLERVLTPSRLQHSLGVMQVMGELSKIYGLNEEKALTAGLLHDAAKNLPQEQIDDIVKAAGIEFHEPCEQEYTLYLHGPVGAFYVQRELSVTDPEILDAIYRHTWVGKIESFEPPLVWCLRFSDILEPYRKWDGNTQIIRDNIPRLRETVFAGQLKEAAFIHTEMIIQLLKNLKAPVHANCYRVYNELSSMFQGQAEY